MTDKVTILIGPPCSGKSSYLTRLNSDFVISSDDIVEVLCRQNQLRYHEYFILPCHHKIKVAHDKIFNNLVALSQSYQHVVWDLTNLTKKRRARIFKHYSGAKFIAVQFDDPDQNDAKLIAELAKRNELRGRDKGKYIPDSVLKEMISSYERANKIEGFSEIVNVYVNKTTIK